MNLTESEKRIITLLRDREQLKQNKQKTVSEFCNLYIETYAKPHKRSWKTDEGRCRLHIIPAWGHRMIDSITRQDMAKLHAALGAHRPYEANRVRELVSKMWTLASEWELIGDNYRNPGKGVKEFPEYSRARYLDPSEVQRLVEAVKFENEDIRLAIMLYLLTGLRHREVLNLRWSDINFERGELQLGASLTKANRALIQPMSSLVRECLTEAAKNKRSDYVIAGKRADRPRHNLNKAWARIKARAELEDIRIHDLRRTNGSWLAQAGFSLHIIAGVLNQSTERVTQVYARLNTRPVWEALEYQSDRLREVLNIPEADSQNYQLFLNRTDEVSYFEPVYIDDSEFTKAVNILSLTDRQSEVLYLHLKGCSGREIADKLGLGTAGVSYHLTAIRQKLRIKSPLKGSRGSPYLVAGRVREVIRLAASE